MKRTHALEKETQQQEIRIGTSAADLMCWKGWEMRRLDDSCWQNGKSLPMKTKRRRLTSQFSWNSVFDAIRISPKDFILPAEVSVGFELTQGECLDNDFFHDISLLDNLNLLPDVKEVDVIPQQVTSEIAPPTSTEDCEIVSQSMSAVEDASLECTSQKTFELQKNNARLLTEKRWTLHLHPQHETHSPTEINEIAIPPQRRLRRLFSGALRKTV